MTALDRVRQKIDAVDLRILALLNARARLAMQAGKLKHVEGGRPGQTAFVPHRERQILDRLHHLNHGPFPNAGLTAVFREIMSASLALEGKPRIACPGPGSGPGQLAARIKFGSQCEYLPVRGIAGVFSAVEQGSADLGVVPIAEGRKSFLREALRRFRAGALGVCGEIRHADGHFLVIGRTLAEPSGKDKTALVVPTLAKAKLLKELKAARVAVAAVTAAGGSSFFIEFMGHQREPRIAQLLRSLGQDIPALRVLGSYPLA